MNRALPVLLALLLPLALDSSAELPRTEAPGYSFSLPEGWRAVSGGVLDAFEAESGPVDAALLQQDAGVAAGSPATRPAARWRSERIDVHPRTPHQWRVRIEGQTGAEVWLDPPRGALSYLESPDAAGAQRMHFAFFGRDRVVILSCAGAEDALASLERSCRDIADGFAWAPGFEPRGEWGRRLVTAAAVVISLAGVGLFCHRRLALA